MCIRVFIFFPSESFFPVAIYLQDNDNHGITEFRRYLWWLPSFDSLFCITCQLLRVFSTLSIQGINEKVKQYRSQYLPLRHNTTDWPPAGLCGPGHSLYSLATQSFQSTSLFIYLTYRASVCLWWSCGMSKALLKSR